MLDELRAYGDMVPVGSYIIVQDTIATGAMLGIRDYLKENPNMVGHPVLYLWKTRGTRRSGPDPADGHDGGRR